MDGSCNPTARRSSPGWTAAGGIRPEGRLPRRDYDPAIRKSDMIADVPEMMAHWDFEAN